MIMLKQWKKKDNKIKFNNKQNKVNNVNKLALHLLEQYLILIQ